MPRSHPPTLLTLTTRTLRDELGIGANSRIVIAVSGGPDSMALLHVLARLRLKLHFMCVAHGVDHGLRPAASAELDAAESFAASLDVRFDRTCVSVPPGSNLQARARAARYDALRAAVLRENADAIATAHHMEDRAETFLLRLLRGSGPRGLAVLPPRAALPPAASSPSDARDASAPIALIRPFLRASRDAIDAHVARHAVPFAIDPSNRDPRFSRARVRHELLPLLRTLSPAIVDHLCALADQLAETRAESPDSSAPDSSMLSRGARELLKTALRSRSPKSRVLLPGGLVATYDRTQPSKSDAATNPGEIVVLPATDLGETKPDRRGTRDEAAKRKPKTKRTDETMTTK